VSVGPTGLDCITAYQIESDELEALVGVTHIRTHNLTEHIRFATASRARTRAPQQFKFQKRFRAIVPGNSQFVSDLLDVRWLQAHEIPILPPARLPQQSEDRLPSLSRPSGF
jgi:hypothetical protein